MIRLDFIFKFNVDFLTFPSSKSTIKKVFIFLKSAFIVVFEEDQ